MSSLSLPWDDQPGAPNNINHVMENDEALRDKINGNINGDNLAADILGSWRTIAQAGGIVVAGVGGAGVKFSFRGSGSLWLNTNNSLVPADDTGGVPLVPLAAADYALVGRATRLRLIVAGITNTTSPAVTFAAGLYAATAAGGVDALNVTLGALQGTAASLVSPPAGVTSKAAGAEYAFPADGTYALGVSLNAATAANSVTALQIFLQLRYV